MLGKLVGGLMILISWIVVRFMLITNEAFLKLFIEGSMQRQAFKETFYSLEPVIWVFVIIITIFVIILSLEL